MASALKKATSVVGTARTAIMTAPAAKQTIVINGLISNNDTANKASHFLTVEVQTGATYRVILKDAPIPYGGSLELPKIVLVAGDVLHMTSSVATHLQAYVSYVEKD